jgi:hypothetical protein
MTTIQFGDLCCFTVSAAETRVHHPAPDGAETGSCSEELVGSAFASTLLGLALNPAAAPGDRRDLC